MTNDQLKKLTPKERMLWFITERENIRIKKEEGYPRPWTSNPILRDYRFCNICRMDDKVSRWLMDYWYVPNQALSPLLAAVFARHINKIESLRQISVTTGWKPNYVKRRLRMMKHPFGSAYVISGAMAQYHDFKDKVAIVIDGVMRPMVVKPPAIDFTSIERSVEALTKYEGIGWFMAGQIVADLRWVVPGDGYNWQDRMLWAAKGPGSCRGMTRYLGAPVTKQSKNSFNQKKFNDLLVLMMLDLQPHLPTDIVAKLEAIDYQNCLCEFDKFERALWGEGRPKRRYP